MHEESQISVVTACGYGGKLLKGHLTVRKSRAGNVTSSARAKSWQSEIPARWAWHWDPYRLNATGAAPGTSR